MTSRYRKFKSRLIWPRGKKNAFKMVSTQAKPPKQMNKLEDQAKSSANQSHLYARFNTFYSKLQEQFERLDSTGGGKTKEENNKSKLKNKKKREKNHKLEEKCDNESDQDDDDDEHLNYLKCLKRACFASYGQSLAKHGYRLPESNSSFIAEGGFGKVVRVYQGDTKYACKIISNLNIRIKTKAELVPVGSAKMISRFTNEVDIMQRVGGHKNIIGYIDSFQDSVLLQRIEEDGKEAKFSMRDIPQDYDSNLIQGSEEGDELDLTGRGRRKWIDLKTCYIIMEYATNKTFSEYIKNEDPLGEPALAHAIGELLEALGFLHCLNIAHRDVKLSNILLFKQPDEKEESKERDQTWKYCIKLCDFGLSSIVDDHEDGYFLKPVGTAVYMSPEILHAYYYYNRRQIDRIVPYDGFKADIWAAGVCLYYSLTGCYPLEMACKSKHSRLEALGNIFQPEADDGGGGGNFEADEKSWPMSELQVSLIREQLTYDASKISTRCCEVLDLMLEIDPNLRPEVDLLLKLDFFN